MLVFNALVYSCLPVPANPLYGSTSIDATHSNRQGGDLRRDLGARQ